MRRTRLRDWFAEALVDWVDHARQIFHPEENPVWDGYVPAPARRLAAAAGATGAGTPPTRNPVPAPVLDLPLLRVCPVCQAHTGAPCMTAGGRVTRPHKDRRQT